MGPRAYETGELLGKGEAKVDKNDVAALVGEGASGAREHSGGQEKDVGYADGGNGSQLLGSAAR